MTPELYHPVLDCFVRGLPHTFRGVDAPVGTTIILQISGECGGHWYLRRQPNKWNLVTASDGDPASRVVIPQELAWRVFTKGIERDSALREVKIEGDRELGKTVLALTAIVG